MSRNEEVGRVSLGLDINSKPAEQQARASAQRIERTFSNAAARIGKVMAAALSVKAIVSFSKKCLELGSDLAEVQNVVDSTFGQGSAAQKAINQFAANAAKQFGLSETMAKRYAGTFGAMSKAFGFADDAAAEMSTTLTGLAGDVASFYNITQDEAYTKLKSVFTGETESLKELGVVMTQTALDQYALSNGFGRTTSAMNEQEKVALRYRFVMDKLSTASGDFARTSGSWANQVRLLKLQFESLCAVIGEVLIQALTPAIQALNAFMGALIKTANTFKSFVFSLFGKSSEDMQAGSAATAAALSGISSGAEDAADSLSGVGDAASDTGDDVSGAAKAIQRSLASFDKITKLSDAGSSGGGSGSSSGSGGSGGAGGLGDTSSALPNTAYDVADDGGPLAKILEKLRSIKDMFVSGFWEGFGDTGVLESIKTHIENIRTSLGKIFGNEDSMKAFSEWIDSLAKLFGTLSGAAASVVATLVDNLLGGMDKWLDKHGEDISSWWQNLLSTWTDINTKVGDLAKHIADIFSVFQSDDAKSCTASIISILVTPVQNAILLLSKFADTWVSNVVKVIEDNKEKIKTALENSIGRASTILETIDSTATKVWKNVQSLYDEHIKPLLDSIGDGISEILGILLDGWNENISPVLDKLSKKFKEVMEDHVDPMLDSLNELLGTIFDAIKDHWEKDLQPMFKWIAENVMPVLKPIVEFIGDKLLGQLSDLADGLKAVFDTVKDVVDKVKDFIDGLKDIDGKKATAEVSLKQNGWTTVKDWVAKYVGGAFSANIQLTGTLIGGAWETIKTVTASLTAAAKKKSYSFKAKAAGDWSKLKGYVSSVVNKIKNKSATFTAKAAGKWDSTLDKAKSLASWIKNRSATYTANIRGDWNAIASKAKTTYDNVKSRTATFTAKAAGYWTTIKDTLASIAKNFWSRTVEFTLKFTSTGYSTVKSLWDRAVSVFKKEGGVYRNGSWRPVQSYASGGNPPGGQIFRARENGNPELVGTIKGSTAVMNNDQIVASVSSGVAKAIAGMSFYSQDRATPHLAMVTDMIHTATSELTRLAQEAAEASRGGSTKEILDVLREILKFLQTADFDVYLDGRSVKDRVVALINADTRSTGRSAIVM